MDALQELDETLGILNENQKIAMFDIIQWYQHGKEPYYIIQGYAGTGKTFIIKSLIKQLGLLPTEVAFCSYTGAAVVNMMMKGNKSATTLHKLIYYSKIFEKVVNHVDGTQEIVREVETRLRDFLEYNKKLIVVDEYSMISDEHVNDLLSFGVKTIFIGDPGQLPPVNANENLLMKKPNIMFTEIVRQGKDSNIIKYADYARKGIAIPYMETKDMQVIPEYIFDSYSEQDKMDIYKWGNIILVGKNETRKYINKLMRTNLFFQNDKYKLLPVIGDKLTCFKNNWDIAAYSPKLDDYLPLVNGTTGIVENIYDINEAMECFKIDLRLISDPDCVFKGIIVSFLNFKGIKNGKLISEFNYNVFDFGYAVTCHKAQGSQYKNVVVHVERLGGSVEDQFKWLYTAITRAEKKLILIMPKTYYYDKHYIKNKDYWISYHKYF